MTRPAPYESHGASATAPDIDAPLVDTWPSPLLGTLVLTVVAGALFAIRLAGQPNLLDNEYRLGAFVLNAIQGGNWLTPHDLSGSMYKPPMLTWLSALVSLPTGHVSRFSLYFPTALATWGTALLIYLAGRDGFGRRAGFLGGLTYLLSYVAFHQMATARWDGLFAFTVTWTAIAGFRAWTRGRGWTQFWLAAAVATLTKGPLGILLAAFGFLAIPWEHRSGRPPPLRGSHAVGVALFLALTVGWFASAYWRMGQHMIDDMFRDEFVGHMVMRLPGHRFWKAPNDFLTNFLPWSVLTIVGLWRVVRKPAVDDRTRRFERFCCCWLVAGLLLFALSPHNPSRLLDPLFPAAALIAGRELDRLVTRFELRSPALATCTVIVVALAALAAQAHHFDRRSGKAKQTVAMLDLRRTVRAAVGNGFPLSWADDVPFAAQLAFDTMRPTLGFHRAAALLRDDAPAYVVVRDVARLRRSLGRHAPSIQEVAASSVGGTPYLHIVSNRAHLEWSDPVAVGLGPLRVRLSAVRLGPTQDGAIVVERSSQAGSVVLTNGGRDAERFVVRVVGHGVAEQSGEIAPGQTLRIAIE